MHINVIYPEPELHGSLYGRISTFHFVIEANKQTRINFVCVSSLSIACTATPYLQLVSLRDALCHLAPSLAQ